MGDDSPMDDKRIHRIKKNARYTLIPNRTLRDASLSWAARGMLAYLLSKPDNWKLRPTDLMRQSPAGRDSVRAILAELETAGYIVRERVRLASGKFEWEARIFEVPHWEYESPPPENPPTVEPPTVEPTTEPPPTGKAGIYADPDSRLPESRITDGRVLSDGEESPEADAQGSEIADEEDDDHEALLEELDQFMSENRDPPPKNAAPPPPKGLAEVWVAALAIIKMQTSRQEFDTWLRGTMLISLDSGTATVGTPSPFHIERLAHRFMKQIARALNEVIGFPVQVRFVIIAPTTEEDDPTI